MFALHHWQDSEKPQALHCTAGNANLVVVLSGQLEGTVLQTGSNLTACALVSRKPGELVPYILVTCFPASWRLCRHHSAARSYCMTVTVLVHAQDQLALRATVMLMHCSVDCIDMQAPKWVTCLQSGLQAPALLGAVCATVHCCHSVGSDKARQVLRTSKALRCRLRLTTRTLQPLSGGRALPRNPMQAGQIFM
jgi:hypothetical protein